MNTNKILEKLRSFFKIPYNKQPKIIPMDFDCSDKDKKSDFREGNERGEFRNSVNDVIKRIKGGDTDLAWSLYASLEDRPLTQDEEKSPRECSESLYGGSDDDAFE